VTAHSARNPKYYRSTSKQQHHKSIHFYLTFQLHLIFALRVTKLRNISFAFSTSIEQIKSSCKTQKEINKTWFLCLQFKLSAIKLKLIEQFKRIQQILSGLLHFGTWQHLYLSIAFSSSFKYLKFRLAEVYGFEGPMKERDGKKPFGLLFWIWGSPVCSLSAFRGPFVCFFVRS